MRRKQLLQTQRTIPLDTLRTQLGVKTALLARSDQGRTRAATPGGPR